VNDEYGMRKLLVNGSVQSGRYIQSLWKGAIKKFGISKDLAWKNILVFGVGGGTVIDILHEKFPNARITAVDIDPMIIDIAKKYFLTRDCSYIRFVSADAKAYVTKTEKQYDCIVIDIFIGNAVPDFVKTKEFIGNCRKGLSPNGVLLVNYLQDREYGEKSKEFNRTLQSIFSRVLDYRRANNRFFNASIV